MPGAIGYVELIYALQNHINFGAVKNAAGNWVKASIDGVTEAAASVKIMPADYRVSITNAPGADAYPSLQLYLSADSLAAKEYGEGKDHEGPAELDASTPAKAKSQLSPMLRFLRAFHRRFYKPSTHCRNAPRGVRRLPGSSLSLRRHWACGRLCLRPD